MSINTTTRPMNGQKTRKNAVKKVAENEISMQQTNIDETVETVEEELGPLSYYTPESENQFLRQMFDFLESINIKTGRKIYYSVPRRVWNIIVGVVALMVLIWATVSLVNVALTQLAWENRPSIMARLAGPYSIDTHPTPILDLSIETGVLPETVGSYNNQLIAVDVSVGRAEFVNVSTRIVGDDGSSFDAVTRGTLQVSNFTGLCLLNTAGAVVIDCGLPRYALYAEAVNYVSGGDTVTVVVAQFADTEQTSQAFTQLYEVSRFVGVVGNYAMLESRAVDYFYSSTSNNFHFTWTNGTWIYTANSVSMTALDGFMSTFPY
jgi:hypothetical protein